MGIRPNKIDKKIIVNLQDIVLYTYSIYQAVTQDCVGMPPVVYNNVNAILRGRPSASDRYVYNTRVQMLCRI